MALAADTWPQYRPSEAAVSSVIMWFRRDLRLADNPALDAAVRSGHRVVPLYIHDPESEGRWAPGAASSWWLHHGLDALDRELREAGLRLVIRSGDTLDILADLITECGAEAVHWNRLYEPAAIARDRRVKSTLRERGLKAESHKAALLYEPWTIRTGNDTPYRAFTPFWQAARKLGGPGSPLPVPSLPAAELPPGVAPDDLELLPRIRWDKGLGATWTPGEQGAETRLERFLEDGITRYPDARDEPAVVGTSSLSPHLHFGEIAPRQIWYAVHQRIQAGGDGVMKGAEIFLSEIGWREFAHHVLYHHPDFPDEPLNTRFKRFPWRDDDGTLERAWRRGETGFPIVDAGMRQLWETGWMHNRVRMIVGSLLVKNLRRPWQRGEAWFWDTLVDADLANNSLGWQWVAGSGADAAPFFRIFNPVRQGERFDADGDYVARWVPEIAALPAKHRHAPWRAPTETLKTAGIRIGSDYPAPVVDLKQSRRAALEAFEHVKASNT